MLLNLTFCTFEPSAHKVCQQDVNVASVVYLHSRYVSWALSCKSNINFTLVFTSQHKKVKFPIVKSKFRDRVATQSECRSGGRMTVFSGIPVRWHVHSPSLFLSHMVARQLEKNTPQINVLGIQKD